MQNNNKRPVQPVSQNSAFAKMLADSFTEAEEAAWHEGFTMGESGWLAFGAGTFVLGTVTGAAIVIKLALWLQWLH